MALVRICFFQKLRQHFAFLNRGWFWGGLAVIGMSVSMPTQASQVSAMEKLQSGYEHCKSAHVLRRKDLDAAESEFQQFLDDKNNALIEYPAIAESEDPEVSRILGYCSTVGSDLSRSQALPVFQLGEKLCGEAAESMQQNLLADAEIKMDQYNQLKSKALSLSEDILDVYSVASVARRCDRLDAQLQEAIAKREKNRLALGNLTGRFDDYLDQCETADHGDIHQLVMLMENLSPADSDYQLWSEQQDIALEQEWAEAVEKHDSLMACRLEIGESVSQQLRAQRQNKRAELNQLLALVDETMLRFEELQLEETEEQRAARLASNLGQYKLINRVSPRFPQKAISLGRSGYVVIQYQVLPSGEVVDPVILESEPENLFNEAALDAIVQWQYQPASNDESPELAIGTTRFSFDLN